MLKTKIIIETNAMNIEVFRCNAEVRRNGKQFSMSIFEDPDYYTAIMILTLEGNNLHAITKYTATDKHKKRTIKASVENFNPFTWEFDWIENGIRYLVRNPNSSK